MKRQSAPKPRLIRVETTAHLAAAQDIRRRIFVEEQGIPREVELDGYDERSEHVLVYIAGRPAATGRLRPRENRGGQIARIAVLPEHRGKGLGALVVRELEAIARDIGLRRVYLEAHDFLETFYKRLGYRTVPGEIHKGGYRLIRMEKVIPQ